MFSLYHYSPKNIPFVLFMMFLTVIIAVAMVNLVMGKYLIKTSYEIVDIIWGDTLYAQYKYVMFYINYSECRRNFNAEEKNKTRKNYRYSKKGKANLGCTIVFYNDAIDI